MAELWVDLTAPNGRAFRQPTGLFINNEYVPSSAAQRIVSINPTDEREICSVEAAGPDEVDAAVRAARAAFHHESWSRMTPSDRGTLIYKLASLVEANADTLATIETWDNGKPYSVSRGDDMPEVIATFRYYAGWADKIHGQTIPATPQKLAYTVRQPMGVCGQIIPWNYPLAMAAWKLAPALACGNTVVIKAAEQTPLSILYLADLFRQAGFPPGVVNVLNGYGREAGAAIASHMDVDKIAFTGSTATGKQIVKMAANNLKSITLETGGKSPLIVLDDADLDQAAKWAHAGIMSNSGQICTATSRILVQRDMHDAFVARFQDAVKKTSVMGDPFSESTFHGPQVSRAQYERVLEYIESGQREGATLASGGRRPDHDGASTQNNNTNRGFFIEPTIFTNVQEHMKIYREEVFGPLVAIAPFDDEADAIHMANDTSYGLGAALFTRNLDRAHRLAGRIDAGTVWINSSNDSDIRVPFGGFKQSGFGRELGEEALRAYCNIKAVHLNLGTRL